MNFLELVTKRCSIRRFASTPVEIEKIEYILEAARLSPSAVNFQPWTFVVVQQEEGKQKLHDCYSREWCKSAPLYIIVCGHHDQSWKRGSDGKDFLDVDAAIAAEHICLAATELGLGTCWVCNFNAELCHRQFGLPDTTEPIAIIPIGYPEDSLMFEQTAKKRKGLSEIVKWEKYC